MRSSLKQFSPIVAGMSFAAAAVRGMGARLTEQA
jgi:hypothetical protein